MKKIMMDLAKNFVIVLVLVGMLLPSSSAVDNADVLNAMDSARTKIEVLTTLLSEFESKIELHTEREALRASKNLFKLGRTKFSEGDLEGAYAYFLKAEEISTEAQKSALIKNCNYTLKIVIDLINKIERAGLPVEEYRESLAEAIKSMERLKRDIDKDQIYDLKELSSFLDKLKSDLQKVLKNTQNLAVDEIIKAERKLEETRYYPFFDVNPAKELLKRAKEYYDGGRYLLSFRYASESREMCESVVLLGKIFYAALIISVLFSTWLFYERSKPENRRSWFYRKLFRRGGGMRAW